MPTTDKSYGDYIRTKNASVISTDSFNNLPSSDSKWRFRNKLMQTSSNHIFSKHFVMDNIKDPYLLDLSNFATLSGNTYTLLRDTTIVAPYYIIVPLQFIFNIPSGLTFTNRGTVIVNGQIINRGTFDDLKDVVVNGEFINKNTFEINGIFGQGYSTLTIHGTFINESTFRNYGKVFILSPNGFFRNDGTITLTNNNDPEIVFEYRTDGFVNNQTGSGGSGFVDPLGGGGGGGGGGSSGPSGPSGPGGPPIGPP
jgi:uncharacterized membrane protein YgcG